MNTTDAKGAETPDISCEVITCGSCGLPAMVKRSDYDALFARLRESEAALVRERVYIKRMDSVIDDLRVAQSCINPLEDLRIAITKLKDALAKAEARTVERCIKALEPANHPMIAAAVATLRGLAPAPATDGDARDAAARLVLAIFEEDRGDIDGGWLQDKAVECGVLVEVEATERCVDPEIGNCACAEYGDFPMTCYRLNSELAAIAKEKE
jgi:hypothetical protein